MRIPTGRIDLQLHIGEIAVLAEKRRLSESPPETDSGCIETGQVGSSIWLIWLGIKF